MENRELSQWIKYEKIHALAVFKPLNLFKNLLQKKYQKNIVFL